MVVKLGRIFSRCTGRNIRIYKKKQKKTQCRKDCNNLIAHWSFIGFREWNRNVPGSGDQGEDASIWDHIPGQSEGDVPVTPGNRKYNTLTTKRNIKSKKAKLKTPILLLCKLKSAKSV